MTERVRVMIAHGIPLVRAGLEAVLRDCPDFEIVSRCDAVPASAEEMAHEAVSVVVSDLDIGLTLATQDRSAECRILIVTHDESEASIRSALEAGVRGYLLLTSTLDALVRAIRDLVGGGMALDPSVASKMLASLHESRLTARELEVLRLMMSGLSNKAIASQLQRGIGTVKTHVRTILGKLYVGSRTEAIAVARKRGLISEQAATVTAHAQTFRNAPSETFPHMR